MSRRACQFAAEEEVLFPPCTMLVITEKPSAEQKAAAEIAEHEPYANFRAALRSEQGREFLQIEAVPTFL